jgi:dimethylargininase
MVAQHAAYVDALVSIGLQVTVLDAELDYPDAHFCEDVAVVTPDIAVIANPGADARKGEENTVEPVLARYRETVRIQPPGTLDGGDVLMIESHFFVGVSDRTNWSGAMQLGGILETLGNTWTAVPVGAGLHLKSSVSYVGQNTLLVTRESERRTEFHAYGKIVVDETEAYAANSLWVNDHVLTPKGFPDCRRKLDALGLPIIELDVSEMHKMDGGLTCLSLRF